MNATYSIRYLAGGDEVFGPNFGGANVFTNVRAGYLDSCPNVGTLLSNLRFTLQMENALMAAILNRGADPAAAAAAWLRESPHLAGMAEGRDRDRRRARRRGGAAEPRALNPAGQAVRAGGPAVRSGACRSPRRRRCGGRARSSAGR